MTAPTYPDSTPTGDAPVRVSNGHRPDMNWPTMARVTATPTHPDSVNGRHPVAPTYRPTDTPVGRHDLPTHRHTPTGARTSGAARRVLAGVSVALGVVILAPLTLSGQDLYRWASSPTGLNLDQPWPWFVPVALDLAAAACIGMTIVAVWRRERPGVFGWLVWIFALVSAFAQYRHGLTERDAGRAQDLWWAMPAFAVLGPLLLEVTLNRIRKWARKDAGEQHSGAAGFGQRWWPGVAFRETLAAWAASRREGISLASDAVQFVRDRRAVAALAPAEAVRYAFGALGTRDPHRARVWLAARHVSVTQADLDAARDRHMSVPPVTDIPTGVSVDTVSPVEEPAVDMVDRQGVDTPTDTPVAPVVDIARRTPTGRPRHMSVKAPDRATPRQVDTPVATPVGGHSPAAVTNATDLRRRYPDGLPSDYQIRKATGWSPDRVKAARAAFDTSTDKGVTS